MYHVEKGLLLKIGERSAGYGKSYFVVGRLYFVIVQTSDAPSYATA